MASYSHPEPAPPTSRITKATETEAETIAGRIDDPSWTGPVTGAASEAFHDMTEAPAHVRRAVGSPGNPLDPQLRNTFQRQTGHDISDVRVHAGPRARESARAIAAKAYTVGRHVVADTDHYRPGTPAGRRLIAHELVHTVHQERGGLAIQRQDNPGAGAVPAEPAGEPAAGDQTAPVSEPLTPGSDAPDRPAGTIVASVGRKGTNLLLDVAAVQDRLLAVGLLTQDSYTAEHPTPTEDPASPPSVPESSLTATIAAIEQFQQPLGISDGNISPAGPTWKVLVSTDAAGFAAMMAAWEQSQRHAAENRQVAEQEQKRKAVADAAAAGRRAESVTGLLDRYVIYLVAGQMIVNVDAAGLGLALKDYATSDPDVIMRVLDQLPSVFRDNVAFELAQATTDDELVRFPVALLQRLKVELTGGLQGPAETAQIARIDAAVTTIDAAPKGAFAALPDEETGSVKIPAITGATFEERITQIRAYYDEFWVSRATTDNCHLAAKRALENIGYSVGGRDTNLFSSPMGDEPLTPEQNTALAAAILAEIRAGNPVEIGVDYKAGHPGNVDTKTDHWLYVVAVTEDDSGGIVLVAYDNADVKSSRITKGNVVYFTMDEMDRFFHPPYYPNSEKTFSNQPHIIVNFRPAHRVK